MIVGVLRFASFRLKVLGLVLVWHAHLLSFGAEWPAFNGPDSDRKSSETLVLKKWKKSGAPVKWKQSIEKGFSSFVVAEGKAFTLVNRMDEDDIGRETLVALDAKSGKELWHFTLDSRTKYDGGGNAGTPNNKGGDGPRSTPAYDSGFIYVTDARLNLVCIEVATGKKKWSLDVSKEYDGEVIRWQNAASPVIDGDVVILAGGGKGQALLGIDKHNGDLKWKVQDDKMTHSTPTLATIHGVRQVIFYTQKGLISVKTEDGGRLWRYKFPFRTSAAASPVVYEDIVYCSSGYGVGAGACKVIEREDGTFMAKEIWRRRNQLINHWSTPVCKDGYLYGLFGFKLYGSAPLLCVDIRTGKTSWSQEGYGPGGLILVNQQLLVLSDAGSLVVVDAKPGKYNEIRREDVLDGKCWSTPAFSNGHVFVRSTSEAACIDLTGN